MRPTRFILGAIAALILSSPAWGQAANGRVTTNAPTYATGSTAPLSLQTDGDLRVGVEDNVTIVGTGTLAVQCTSGCSASSGPEDEDAFTLTTTGVTPMGCIEATDSIPAGSVGAVKCGADRELDVDATIASGGIASGAVASGAFAAGSISSGAIASGAVASGAIASGAVASGAYATGSISAGAIAAGASSLVKLEDVLSADADAGVPAMCTRKATAANVSGSDGDYEFLQCSAGRLWTSTTVDTALPAGNANIGDVDVASIAAGDNDIGNVDLEFAGTAASTNNGASGAQTLRVTIANDSTGVLATVGAVTAITNALPAGDNDIGNVDLEFAGTAASTNSGNVGPQTLRVVNATDQPAHALHGHGVNASAAPANSTQVGFRTDGGHAAGTPTLKTPIICENSAAVAATADNANTEIVALTSSETIYVCGMMLIADAASTVVQLIYGTGSACATGETDLTGSIPLTTNTGFSSFSPFPIMFPAVSNAFCIEITGTGNVHGWVTYTKF